MKIAAIVSTHGSPDVTMDTVASVNYYMTNDVVLLVDGAGWHHFYPKYSDNVCMLKGLYHNYPRSPYRNIVLGLMSAAKQWPDHDWYTYIEYDALVGSSSFKKDLELAAKSGVWLLGNDYREKQTVKFPLIELMLKTKFEEVVYLLGAVLFYHKNFIKKLMADNFLDRFLFYTNEFKNGFFPGYVGPAAYDLIEHLMPTLAKHWGGKVCQLAKWSQKFGTWVGGNYRRYPIRWQPDLFFVEHEYLQSAIMHPLKTFDHPVREFHRTKRENRNVTI